MEATRKTYRRWEDGMRMSLRETGWVDVEWTQMVQDSDRWRALVNALKNLRVLAPGSFARQTASLEIITLALQTAKNELLFGNSFL
jgi:hypothetical protein